MITQDQKQRILEKLAYNFGELCKYHNFNTTSEYNWKKADQLFKIEIETNGEKWLLSLLEETQE
jgi:hypothetical protein